MPDVFIAADDFTGANAAAAGLHELGLSAITLPVGAGPATVAEYADAFDVAAFTTDSRHLDSAQAARATERAVTAAWPARLVSSRCDSTLRGNMAAEAVATVRTVRRLHAEESGPVIGLCMPSFPASGRTTVHGRQLLHGVPLEQTELVRDVRSPIATSDVRAVLREGVGAAWGVEHLDIAAVEAGPAPLQSRFRELLGTPSSPRGNAGVPTGTFSQGRSRTDGGSEGAVESGAEERGTEERDVEESDAAAVGLPDVIVADARTNDDLLAVARAAVAAGPRVTWVAIDPGPGSAALAQALGLVRLDREAHGIAGSTEEAGSENVPAGTLGIAGSAEGPRLANVPAGTPGSENGPVGTPGPAKVPAGTPRRLIVPAGTPGTARTPTSIHEMDGSTGRHGTILAVCGSATELTREQLAHLCDERPTRAIRPILGPAGGIDVPATASAALTGLREDPSPGVLLLATVVETADLRELTAAQSDALSAQLGRLASRVLAAEPARISGVYTTGGDVTSAVLREIGAAGIAVERQVLPLATLGRVVGGGHDGMPILTKGGLVGDAATASACVGALQDLVGRESPNTLESHPRKDEP